MWKVRKNSILSHQVCRVLAEIKPTINMVESMTNLGVDDESCERCTMHFSLLANQVFIPANGGRKQDGKKGKDHCDPEKMSCL
jgi:hypothetical protein